MTRQEFKNWTAAGPVILDGATGTNLMEAGMPVGVCPELWVLEHPDVLVRLQRGYVEAGSGIVYAPTFSANRIKLAEYGLEDRLEEINSALVRLSREAVGDGIYVAADMTMTGQQLAPVGEMGFEELVDVYRQQAQVLAGAGADLFVVETMMSLQECRAAVLAIREVCELPVMVTLTYNENGRTLYGTPPEAAVVVLQSLGADAVGINCSTGPKEMLAAVKKMADYATVPVIAKPNAGMPALCDDENNPGKKKTVYRMSPETFAAETCALVEAGASIVGGCCGTNPSHIRALAEAVGGMTVQGPRTEARRVLASERSIVEIEMDGRFLVVGERINPTGKKKLQQALKDRDLELVCDMAREQVENGASVLDVNMGMNGIDEKEMMELAVTELVQEVNCPLCIDTSRPDVMEAALRLYPGRALVNSVSLEEEKIRHMLPLVKKYGAMFVLLPLSDAGLPRDGKEKQDIIESVYEKAMALGIHHTDIVVDGLVATVGANPNAARECFETIAWCSRKRLLPTICGLSNISFGLPERGYVNAAFLSMAIANGLTMAIANPSQELLMSTALASDMLLNRKDSGIRYIEGVNRIAENRPAPAAASKKAAAPAARETDHGVSAHPVFAAVLKGSRSTIVGEVQKELDAGTKPETVLNDYLIAAINEVGALFERKKYFLPQLIASANAMKLAVDYLEPMLERDSAGKQAAKIVMATVEGDIHDIGKNLVVLMLKNHGYEIIDLGKDVCAEVIVDTAIREQAAVIGLSALMTTTMMRMKDVVELCRSRGCKSRVIVGGACITESFAQEIGADGYSKDAAECVRLVERLLGE